MFPLAIGVNIIMLILNKTDTFNADLWNVWGKIFTAVAAYYITGSVAVAFVIAAIQVVFELKLSDYHQYRITGLSGIPGVTCTHKMTFLAAPMYIVDCILCKIPVLNKSFNARDLRNKLGIFAENHVLGFLLGVLFGVLARYNIARILTMGVQCATALTLFPVISKYFSQALEPISNAVSEYMQTKFSGREMYVGLDWPFMGGASEIWLVIILTIPVTLLMSFFLPGNQILPFAGIVNISIAVPAYLVCKGNVLRMWIECFIFTPVFLWVGTAFAPFMTELANSTRAVELASGQLISNSSIDAPIFTYAFSHAAKVIQGDFVPLIILLAWLVCFVLYSRALIKEKQEALAKGSV